MMHKAEVAGGSNIKRVRIFGPATVDTVATNTGPVGVFGARRVALEAYATNSTQLSTATPNYRLMGSASFFTGATNAALATISTDAIISKDLSAGGSIGGGLRPASTLATDGDRIMIDEIKWSLATAAGEASGVSVWALVTY